jgi:4-hydroxyphenylpyruvate dioxygenase
MTDFSAPGAASYDPAGLGDERNPLGIAGLAFVEFACPAPQRLATLFRQLGFLPVGRHLSKDVTLYRHADMHFLLNAEPDSFASRFAEMHGVGICALGMRVLDAQLAQQRAVASGAWEFEGERIGPNELAIPAIQGIGDSHLYFVDQWAGKDGRLDAPTIFDIDFAPLPQDAGGAGATADDAAGLYAVDHFTQTVGAGRLPEWLDFYLGVLHFDMLDHVHPDWHAPEGSSVVVSPCGSIRIPVYEQGATRTELMQQYISPAVSEGVQHIALASRNIVATVDALRARGVRFVEPPPRYYEGIDARLGRHGVDIDALRTRGILIDGEPGQDGEPQLFLQIFIALEHAEMSFEIVERRGHHGFGEGNLTALARARRDD